MSEGGRECVRRVCVEGSVGGCGCGMDVWCIGVAVGGCACVCVCVCVCVRAVKVVATFLAMNPR